MANTTWSTTDKTANVILSGGNLTASANSASIGGVRAIDRQISGKFYWEVTYVTTANPNNWIGVAYGWPGLSAQLVATGVYGACGLAATGTLMSNGVQQVVGFASAANGQVVCVAIDVGAGLVWIRQNAGGNWNNSGTANPATSAGGVVFPAGPGYPVHPCFQCQSATEVVTANFGDSAFTGTVPSGFTSGFTAGASIPTNALATQVAAEHWLTTSPDAQITQVALEHWATVTGTGLQAVVTQVALEHWASVANVPAFVNGPIITMIG